MHCRTRENAATYPLQRLQARPRSPRLKQRRHPTATFYNNNAVSFLYQSTQHFDIGPYKPTFRKHRSKIGSHIYAACLIVTLILFPIYPSQPIESASCRPQSLWLSLLHSIYHSVAKFCLTCPCQITATTNVMNHFCTRYALFACSIKPIGVMSNVLPLSDIHFAVVRQG